jgi:phospholipase C
MCIENPSPSWNEAHVDWDYNDQVGLNPAASNGFVWTAAHDARALNYYDTNGLRAMGYYDGGDLNYLYFMASNFATSDRWFNPAMSRTNINREYLLAATSGGYAYPNGTDDADTPQLTSKTIFQALQNASISWKIYVDTEGSSCAGPPYQASCLMKLSYLQNFTYAQTVINQYPTNIAPMSQYFTDLNNGTLPQVSEIEPASDAGEDEHPSDSDNSPANIQSGEVHVEQIINSLMTSSAWSRRVWRHLRSRSAATGAQSRRHQAGRFAARRHLHYDHRSNLRLCLHGLPRTPRCRFPVREEELRVAYGHRLYGDAEVHRSPL